jgi:glycosyltransferase involved in cell wall biosynthesis
VKPRVLLVGRTRYSLPLSPTLARRFDALRNELDVRVLAAGDGHDTTFRLARRLPALDGPAFYGTLPFRIARQLREFRPVAVLAQSPYEGAAALAARRLARTHTPVVVDVHGDPRTFSRLYGSRARRVLAPAGDALAVRAIRAADAVRTVSPFTTRVIRDLGVEPADEFPAFMELDAFAGECVPLPPEPQALFVGVLERYKGIDVLLRAWARVQVGTLRIVGDGSLAALVTGSQNIEWAPRLAPREVAQALNESWCLVLPSRSEGMGRVLVEAFCRGRAVVGTRAGSIPDLVRDGQNGLLVPTEDSDALAAALTRLLEDRALAERLGEGARVSAATWLQTPEEWAARTRALVERVLR